MHPLCVNYNLFYFIFMNYIKTKYVTELIPILNLLNIEYNLI